MPVKAHPDTSRLERLEWRMFLEQVGTGEAEHAAGVPMPGHHRHSAVAVALLVALGCPRSGVCRFTGFPTPVSDDAA